MGWLVTVVISSFLLFLASSEKLHWKQKRDHHKCKTLTEKKMLKVSKLGDMMNFRKELRPLLIERYPGSEGHETVQYRIKSQMKKLGWDVQDDPFEDVTPYGVKKFTNIIATHNPKSLRRLVLACHYDSKFFKDTVFIGAMDSAVPCAMLIHLATVLNTTLWKSPEDNKKDLTLQFFFFDGEEAFKEWTETDSIYGARHLARRFEQMNYPYNTSDDANVLHSIDVLVLLDLIGARDPSFYSWFDRTRPLFERLHKIEKKLEAKGVINKKTNPFFKTTFSRNGGGIEDDHIPFLKRHVPVLHLIPYPFPQTWHTPYDDEAYLDYPTIEDLNKIFRVFVAEYLRLDV